MAPTIPPVDAGDWKELLQAARAGSQPALGALLDACRQYLLLVANGDVGDVLRSKAGASDLVQETFLKAGRHFADFHGQTEKELLSWLRQILLHTLIDLKRHHRCLPGSETREVPLSPPVAAQTAALAEPQPIEVLIQDEEARVLYRALEQLSEDRRRVVYLRHRDRLSFVEIGLIMHRSTEAARKLWSRAIEDLQQTLEPAHGIDQFTYDG